LEVVVIVTTASTKRQRDGEARATPTSTTDPLLIVETHRWHVRHHHREQRTDVHACFHRCCDAQQIQFICSRFFGGTREANALKEALPVSGL
jgi:hypothetical protein